MDNRPIGVFDSGLGGLTTVKELRRLLPDEQIVYFGDTGRVPYGTRSRETIMKYAGQDIRFLLGHNVKMIISACATVSSTIPYGVGKDLQIPFTGVLLPAAQAACALSSGGVIGVVGTPATIRLGEFGRLVRGIRPEARVVGNACPLLVPIVESGLISPDDEIARLAVERYVKPLKAEGVDTLILGCTHYPLLYEVFNRAFDYQVTLIDSGLETARSVRRFLSEQGMLSEGAGGGCEYYVTDSVDGFSQIAELFLGNKVDGHVHQVDLDTL